MHCVTAVKHEDDNQANFACIVYLTQSMLKVHDKPRLCVPPGEKRSGKQSNRSGT